MIRPRRTHHVHHLDPKPSPVLHVPNQDLSPHLVLRGALDRLTAALDSGPELAWVPQEAPQEAMQPASTRPTEGMRRNELVNKNEHANVNEVASKNVPASSRCSPLDLRISAKADLPGSVEVVEAARAVDLRLHQALVAMSLPASVELVDDEFDCMNRKFCASRAIFPFRHLVDARSSLCMFFL
jgi:hypothetical protein